MLKNILISSIIGISPIMSQFINIKANEAIFLSINEYQFNKWDDGTDSKESSSWTMPSVIFDYTNYVTNWTDFISKYSNLYLDSFDIHHIYVMGCYYSLKDEINIKDIGKVNWDNPTHTQSKAFFYRIRSENILFAYQKVGCEIKVSHDSKYIYFQNKWEYESILAAFGLGLSVDLKKLILV